MQDDRLKTSLANAVVRLFRLVNRVHNRKLKEIGISAEQAHVLTVLGVEGPMTIGRLQRLARAVERDADRRDRPARGAGARAPRAVA